jgi:competence protein ComEC
MKKKRIIKKILIILFSLSISFYFFYSYKFEKENNNLEVYFFDSGQADSILIKTPEQKNIIIDFGSEQGLKELEKIIPWWNKKIDLIIITHPHDDHITGLIPIIKKYQINKIIYTGINYSSNTYNELLQLIDSHNIPLEISSFNKDINLGIKCNLKIIYPIDNMNKKTVDDINDSSIISHLNCKNKTFIFMGDAGINPEEEIMNLGIDLKSDVIKISHHGSITATSQKFLEKVNPKIAIIMVGKDNSFDHPNLRIIKRLERENIKIFRTDKYGTIKIISDGNKLYTSY